MTRGQFEALRILSDGSERPTSRKTWGAHIAGTTASALVRRGWDSTWGVTWVVTITDEGRAALAAEELRLLLRVGHLATSLAASGGRCPHGCISPEHCARCTGNKDRDS